MSENKKKDRDRWWKLVYCFYKTLTRLLLSKKKKKMHIDDIKKITPS